VVVRAPAFSLLPQTAALTARSIQPSRLAEFMTAIVDDDIGKDE
jgi:hypothetical protein